MKIQKRWNLSALAMLNKWLFTMKMYGKDYWGNGKKKLKTQNQIKDEGNIPIISQQNQTERQFKGKFFAHNPMSICKLKD